jgi:flagellar basal-body rod protein FlgB
MPVSDIPILAMLRTRMAWGQERQGVLATVTNADTPRFKPRDLVPPDCGRPAPATDPVALVRTDFDAPERLRRSSPPIPAVAMRSAPPATR